MASACIRSMTVGQNIHLMPQNCVIISSGNSLPISQVSHLAMQPGKTPIAPAPSTHSNRSATSVLGMNGINVQSSDAPRYKKKYTYANMPYGEQPPSVARRNARERNRVKQVNNGFANLRQHIPQTIITTLTNGGRGASKKLSKVDTLKLAVEYIRRLKDLLDDADSDAASTSTLNSQGSSTGSTSYYSASPDHFSTPCSDSASSPTPSYSSDISIGSNNYIQSTAQFKFEPYDTYSTMRPEDEELLDYISSWQEQ